MTRTIQLTSKQRTMTLCITSLFVLDRFVDFLGNLCLDDGAHLWAEDIQDAVWNHESAVG